MLRVAGLGQRDLLERVGIMFTVRHCRFEYLRSATLDDELEVHTALTGIGGASVSARQIVKRAGEDLVRSHIKLACVNSDGRPKRIPTDIKRGLASLPNVTKDDSNGK